MKHRQSKKNNDRESFIAWLENIATCGKLLAFISSLQEEPASEDLEEETFNRQEDYLHTLWPKCPYGDFRIVEGEIVKDIHNQLSVKSEPLNNDTFGRFGDKVKIIVIKEK